mmetsp:Transcript_2641/g.8480  ORF Transcript_2641/g.8480 Transcript_2641/m.8480 type:complete len:305 (+) Transcript_2641:444-1358(+)
MPSPVPVVPLRIAQKGERLQRPPGRARGAPERAQQVVPLRRGVLRAVVAGVDAGQAREAGCGVRGDRARAHAAVASAVDEGEQRGGELVEPPLRRGRVHGLQRAPQAGASERLQRRSQQRAGEGRAGDVARGGPKQNVRGDAGGRRAPLEIRSRRRGEHDGGAQGRHGGVHDRARHPGADAAEEEPRPGRAPRQPGRREVHGVDVQRPRGSVRDERAVSLHPVVGAVVELPPAEHPQGDRHARRGYSVFTGSPVRSLRGFLPRRAREARVHFRVQEENHAGVFARDVRHRRVRDLLQEGSVSAD